MIKRLKIHNFKSIVDVEIEFSPLTVLIGRSGTGKTNIVEAIRFWRDLLRHTQWPDAREKWATIQSASTDDRRAGLQIEFDTPGLAGVFKYDLRYDCSPLTQSSYPILDHESLTYDHRVQFVQDGGEWLQQPNVVRSPPPRDVAIGSIYGIPEIKLAYLFLTQGIGCYDFGGDVLCSKKSEGNHNGSGLADHADNFLSIYGTLDQALGSEEAKQIIAALRQLNPTIATLDLDSRLRNTIYVGQRTAQGKALTLELSQQSEGFRRFLAHLLALYQIPNKPTVIFEEAEKGIYPGALAALAEHFKSVAEKGASQVILTTHSPQLLDHFPVESLRVVEMEDYRTKVGAVAPEQVEAVKQNLLSAGQLLTNDPARIADQG